MEREKVVRENELLKQQLMLRQQQEQDQARRQEWEQEAQSVKNIYSNFDLQNELKNPKFVQLLRSGAGMKSSFEVLHMNELMSGAMQYTAQQVAGQVANNIKAKGSRPSENGTASNAAAAAKSDVSRLSKADRDEISRRILRGEKITFG